VLRHPHPGARRVSGDVRLAVHITREDLGRTTGTSRESANRARAYFEHKGWVRGSHGRYLIDDANALGKLAGGR